MKPSFDQLVMDHRDEYGCVVLELGPGERKWHPHSIGVDILGKDTVDYICDLSKGFPFAKDCSIDLIYASHFLEHIDNISFFLGEVNRVLRKGGKMLGVVPHFSNPYFYSDYTHKNFWGLYTILYFSKDSYFARVVPSYYNSLDFKVNRIRLEFRSPFFVRNLFKKILTKVVNSSKYMQELYEELFSGVIPCYEIHFEIEKK